MSSRRWKLAAAIMSVALTAGTPAWAQHSRDGSSAQVSINQVNSFEISEGEAGTMIRIKGSSVPTFSVFKLADPPRLFIDLSHSSLKDGDGEVRSVDNGVISQVALIGVEDSSQTMTRVIVGFDKAAHYDVRAEGNDVLVFIDGEARRAPENVDAKIAAAASSALDAERDRFKEELSATRSRLESTEQELVTLRQQAKKARGAEKRALDKKIEEKNAELTLAQRERDEAQQKLARAEAERKDAIKRAQDAELLASEAGKQRELTERELATWRARADKLAEKTSQLQEKEAVASKKAASLEERAETLEQELESLRSEVARSGSTSSAAKKELARLEKAQALNAKELDEAKQARKQAQRDREQSERQLTTAQNALKETQQELTVAQARASELEKSLEAQQKEMTAMQSELKRLKQEREELAGRRARLEEERNELSSEREDLNARNADLSRNQSRSKELARRLEQAERELEAANARQQELVAQAEAAKKERLAQAASIEARASDKPAARAVPVDVVGPNLVKDIRLETSNGRSRIVVELDRPGNFETLPGHQSRAVMILNNTQLPAELERTLSTEAQGGAVRFVSSFVDGNAGESVRMEAELDGEVAETVRTEGNTLVWEFAPALAQNQVASQDALPEEVEPRAPEAGDSFTSAPPLIVTDPTKVSRVPGMSRKRLTIDLRNADIQNVLRLISREGGVNIIAGDDVSGTVTMRLRGVPLEEAFLTILQSQGLGFEKRANVIRVTTQKTLLDEQTARAAARQAQLDSQPLEVFLLPINYAEASDLTGQIQGILSSRGSVTVDERTNTLIIKDVPDNLEPIRVLIESLDTQVPQVLIEARIVETNDTFQRQIGIQWGGQFGLSQQNGNPTGLIFPSTLGVAGGATDGQTPNAGVGNNQPNYAVNLPAPVGTGSGGGIGLTMGSVGGNVNLNLRLTALEEAGHARIVSAPKILTLDNNEASISQGTSIPISVVGAAGVQTVFVQAVLELVVTPHVTPDGNIQLHIAASKNEPDFQNTGARGDPTIIRRNAETELLIKDGDTTVIGGIYTRNSGTSISAVPFLHKIPILGFFFRSNSESERRSELLIFITPRIVNRAEALGVISAGAVQSGSGGNSGGSNAGGGAGASTGGGDVLVNPF